MKPRATNVSLAALLLVALPSAQSRRLNGPLAPDIVGGVLSSIVSPDGARVVFHADIEVENQFDLYSVPIGGGAAVRLNAAPAVPGLDVSMDYLVTPDSARVVYRAAQPPNGEFQLYSVPIAGGPSIHLNGTLPAGQGGKFAISASTGRVVYKGGGNLYSVPIDGSAAPVQLNAGAGFEQIELDFALSFDGLGVAYRSDAIVDDRIDLWVARVDGTLPPQLRAAGPGESDVLDFVFAPLDAHLVYRADHENAGVRNLYSVPVVGGAPTLLDATLTTGGSVSTYAISPDGARVAYMSFHGSPEPGGLYSVAIGGGAVTELDQIDPSGVNRFVVGGAAPYRVVYLDDADGNDERDLHTVPLEGGASSQFGAPGTEVEPWDFGLSPDGARVVYRALDMLPSSTRSLYSAPIEGGTALRLNVPFDGGFVSSFQIAPDSASVVYGNGEVWSVPIDGGASTRLSVEGAGGSVPQFDPTGARVVYRGAGLCSVASSGGPSTRLDPPGATRGTAGDVLGFRLHPDGTRAVYLADQEADEMQELFGVKTSGGAPVRLNAPFPPFVSSRDVTAFDVSPDWSRVVYRADHDVNDAYRLYGAPIDGGAPVALDAGPVAGGDVEDFLVSPDSARVVYRADQDVDGVFELFSVPIEGGPVVQLSPALVTNGDVSAGLFRISPDSSRVVYIADQDTDEMFELWSVPIAGGAAVRLNGALVAGSDVVSLEIAADSSRVVYLTHPVSGGRDQLRSVPLAGGSVVLLNGTLQPSGDVTSYRLAADSSHVVYRADQDADEVFELFSVPMAGGTALRLNPPLVAGGDVDGDFAISADSSRVLYRADQQTDGVVELFDVPIDGGASARLNTALPAGRSVSGFQIAPDSTRAVYRADQDTNDVFELYGVELATGTITRLHAPLAPGGSTAASGWIVMPDSLHVVARCDRLLGIGVRLWALPFSGAGPRPLSGYIGGFTQPMPIDVRSGRVVYIASIVSQVNELFVATLPRPMRDGSVPSGQ